MRVVIEAGLRGKKVAAVAPDWPGLERGAKTAEAATEQLVAYLPRYAPVAKLAGLGAEFAKITSADVVERYPGTGSTDFWGISFASSSIDKQEMTGDQLERELALMQASWAFFDQVRSRVSPEMKKGPRGGGRDRDRIVRHVVLNAMDWARALGLPPAPEATPTDEELVAHRDAVCAAIRAHHAQGKPAGRSPLRFLIRHTAFHTLDHTWEMEDKDLSATGA